MQPQLVSREASLTWACSVCNYLRMCSQGITLIRYLPDAGRQPSFRLLKTKVHRERGLHCRSQREHTNLALPWLPTNGCSGRPLKFCADRAAAVMMASRRYLRKRRVWPVRVLSTNGFFLSQLLWIRFMTLLPASGTVIVVTS